MTNIVRFILPVALGVLFALGDNVAMNMGHLQLNDFSLYINMFALIVLFIALYYLIDIETNRFSRRNSLVLSDTSSAANITFFSDEKVGYLHLLHHLEQLLHTGFKGRVLLGLFIFACWLPYLIALHPGVYWADDSSQLIQYYGGAPLTDHHPYIDTLLFGFFSDLGRLLFQSESAGLYVLIIIQALLASLLFALLATQTYRFGAHIGICFGLSLFCAIFPFFPVMFSSLAKDTISALFFMAFCYQLSETLYTGGIFIKNPKFLALIITTAIFLSLTKKTMAYVATPCLFLLAFAIRKEYRRFAVLACIATGITVFILYPSVLLPYLNVNPGGKQEVLAVPIQQIAHDVTFNGDEIDSADRKLIDEFLSCDYEDIPSLYNFEIADGVKGRSLQNEDLLPEFLLLWLNKTMEHPLGHLEAWLGLAHGWIGFRNSDGSANNMVVLTESLWYEEPVFNYVDWPQSDSQNAVLRNIYDFIESVPVINFLFQRSTWATVLPFALLFTAMGKHFSTKRALVLLAPVLLSTLSLALVPVSGMGGEPTRYVFQSVCLIPFLLFQLPLLGNNRVQAVHKGGDR